MTFSVSLGSFGVALILSKRFSVLPLELFHQFTAILDTPLAIVLIAIAMLLNYGAGWWTSRIALHHA